MPATTLPLEWEDVSRLGRDAFDRHVRTRLTAADAERFVAVDVATGDYEIDDDDYTANMRLLARLPGARAWLVRAGDATTCSVGCSSGRIE